MPKTVVVVHFWGGEGYLSSATFHLMALMGMFENIPADKILYRNIDAATGSIDDDRWQKLCNAYRKYRNVLYGGAPKLECEDINAATQQYDSILDRMTNMPATPRVTLKDRFPGMEELLAIGISESDMDNLNFKGGVFGKPYAGEVFYSNSNFGVLYSGCNLQPGDTLIIINCGGYRGGGTAATFIPLESNYEVSVARLVGVTPKRFSIIAGPSTQFDRTVKIDKAAYAEPTDEKVDVFEIDKVKAQLNGKTIVDQRKHDENIRKLDGAKPQPGMEDLNPDFYMGKFIDKLRSDQTINQKIDGAFVNMKTKLTLQANGTSYDYDVTSDGFDPWQQDHRLHITNLLNAVEIKEVITNLTAYDNGHHDKVYGFRSTNPFYTISDVFDADDVKKFYHFLELIVIITEYIRPYFDNLTLPKAERLYKKWALVDGHNFALAGTGAKDEYNRNFAQNVKSALDMFLKDCGEPVLHLFREINNASPDGVSKVDASPLGSAVGDVQFFSKASIANNADSLYMIIETLMKDINVGRLAEGRVKGKSKQDLIAMGGNAPTHISSTYKDMLSVMLAYSQTTAPDGHSYVGMSRTINGLFRPPIIAFGNSESTFEQRLPRLANNRPAGDPVADAADYADKLLAEVFKFVNEKIN